MVVKPVGGSARQLRFSNPDVYSYGYATGTDENNNAGVINSNKCIVANLSAPTTLSVNITGNSNWCGDGTPYFPYIYVANVNSPTSVHPGSGPYSYEWRVSQNGNFSNGLTVWSTDNSLTLNYAPNCLRFYVQCKVTASDGLVVTDEFLVDVSNCNFCDYQYRSDHTYITSRYDNRLVWPNPVNERLYIGLDCHLESSTIIVGLYNAIGQLETQITSSCASVLNLDVSKIKLGVYSVVIKSPTSSSAHKIVIER